MTIYLGEANDKFEIKDDILQENMRDPKDGLRQWKILYQTGEWMILGQMGELQTANALYLIHYSCGPYSGSVPKGDAPDPVKVVFNLLK